MNARFFRVAAHLARLVESRRRELEQFGVVRQQTGCQTAPGKLVVEQG